MAMRRGALSSSPVSTLGSLRATRGSGASLNQTLLARPLPSLPQMFQNRPVPRAHSHSPPPTGTPRLQVGKAKGCFGGEGLWGKAGQARRSPPATPRCYRRRPPPRLHSRRSPPRRRTPCPCPAPLTPGHCHSGVEEVASCAQGPAAMGRAATPGGARHTGRYRLHHAPPPPTPTWVKAGSGHAAPGAATAATARRHRACCHRHRLGACECGVGGRVGTPGAAGTAGHARPAA